MYYSGDCLLQYFGVPHTLLITYLCPRHVGQVDLAIRLAWPTTADGVRPEDITAPG